MNSLIQTLNHWGDNFVSFAGPMLWQSSLLILAVYIMERLLRQKLRASVRYALWLVVLVKLCVSPTLALPTSPAWWIHQTPAAAGEPSALHYTVTYDNDALPQATPKPDLVPQPARAAMTGAAWLVTGSGMVSAGLLAWLLVRWRQVSRKAGQAGDSERLTHLRGRVQESAGMNFKVMVKVTTHSMSPAVCGLFRPVILMPAMLAERFSDDQLQAVLLHELIHLKRRDVWVNFFQSLLQIVYWWHPLVWVANARIRRVREEAVDDVVMLALREGAEAYAPTLLEVAKLALNRPLASLGLVGILESRRALRQRIERLVDFRPPRRAGMTLISVIGILAFTAMAVPMGPGPEDTPTASMTDNSPAQPAKKQVFITAKIYVLSADDFAKAFRRLDSLNYNVGKSFTGILASNHVDEFNQRVDLARLKPLCRPRIQTTDGVPAEMTVDDGTNSFKLHCLPVISPAPTGEQVNLSFQMETAEGSTDAVAAGPVITTHKVNSQAVIEDHGSIIVCGDFTGQPVKSNLMAIISVQILTNGLASRVKAAPGEVPDARAKAAAYVLDAKVQYEMGKMDGAEKALHSALALDPANAAAKYYLDEVQARHQKHSTTELSGFVRGDVVGRDEILKRLKNTRLAKVSYGKVPLKAAQQDLSWDMAMQDFDRLGIHFFEPPDVELAMVNMPLVLTNVSAQDVLNAICLAAKPPVQYRVMNQGLEFSWKGQTTPNLFTRSYALDTRKVKEQMQRMEKSEAIPGGLTNGPLDLTAALSACLKSQGFDFDTPPGKTIFFSEHEQTSMLMVKATLQDMETVEKVIQIFSMTPPQVHIKARFFEVSKKDFSCPDSMTNNSTMGIKGILTSAQAKNVLKMLRADHAEIIAEPEVVTTTARQTQMRSTEVITVITNLVLQPGATNGGLVPQTTTIETGPVLDVVPMVLADGYTVNLTTIVSMTSFLGYDTPSPKRINDAGELLPTVSPLLTKQQAVASFNVWDGQTIMLGKIPSQTIAGSPMFDSSLASPGHLKRTQVSKIDDKELVVLITVNVVDPTGNRVHSDDEMSFARDAIPPQN